MELQNLAEAVKIVAKGYAKRVDTEEGVKVYLTGKIIRVDIPQALILETADGN